VRTAALLLLLAAAAPAEDWVLLGIRDNPKQDYDAAPPRTHLTIDVLAPDRLLTTRRITISDPEMRKVLFNDPFLVAAHRDLAYLICASGQNVRCLRLVWSAGEEQGKSFLLKGCHAFRTRPVLVVPERIGLLTRHALLSLDLSGGIVVRTQVPNRPLWFDVQLNRVYVSEKRWLHYHPLLSTDPPAKLDDTKPLFRLPDELEPAHAAVRSDGLQVAYVSYPPTRRLGANRFVLSVSDSLERLLVRRSLPGHLRDLRWSGAERLVLTTTDREKTTVHVLEVKNDRLKTMRLPARYLAPPEIVGASLIAVPAKN
jgi:hypothetical protein